MSRRVFARSSGRIAQILITVTVALGCQPVVLLAQEGFPAPGQASPQVAPEFRPFAPGASDVIDQATLQRILTRLEAAEAEIRTLRARSATPAGSPAPQPAPAEGDSYFTSLDATSAENNAAEATAGAAPAKDKPPVIKFLTPLSGECGNITFTPGLRLQPRYTWDQETDNNDIFLRRFRLKGGGDAFGVAKYGTEFRIDNTGRFGKDPTLEAENAWIDFPVDPELTFRVGLYDVPFSRNSLTSDSKLLLMDRTLIKEALTTVGLADNTIGLMAHGRPWGGQLEYAVGVFDNIRFDRLAPPAQESKELMPAGRIVFNLLDPVEAGSLNGYADYRESWIGQGERLAIGANSAHLGSARQGLNEFDLYAWGVDLFFNMGRFTFQAEYDWFTKDMLGATPNVTTDGWYVQAGYLIHPAIELTCQYEVLDPNTHVTDDTLRWTHVGFNVYFREHNLKLQTDYVFKNEQGNDINNDLFQVQLQLDY